MLSRLILVFGLLAAALLPASDAQAERRIALVVGNSEYVHAKTLRNPRNDAADIAETLKRLGFEVLLGLDLDQQNFARLVEQYARRLDDADVGLFYYAGHGLQINEKNYLVSTTAKLENEFLVSAETLDLESIIRLMESKTPVNLIFLDACRNNPLSENLRRNLAAMRRSAVLGRGLARIEPTGRDTLVAFAAAPGQEAADGRDRNSPFTQALLKHLPTPGLEVSVMLKEVTADVRRETQNAQRPQQLSDMSRTFYFAKAEPLVMAKVEPSPAPEPKPMPALPSSDDRALEVAFWNAAQSANQCEAVRAYLQRFPNGNFVELGKLAERRLCESGRRIEMAATPAMQSPELKAAPSVPQDPSVPPLHSSASAQPAAPIPGPAIAALPEPSAAVDAPKPAAEHVDLARDIQRELVRLGCSSGKVDGKWGPSTGAALRRFNKSARASLDTDVAASETLSELRAHDGRICAPAAREENKTFTIERDTPRKPRRAARTPEPRRVPPRRADVEIRQPRVLPSPAAPRARAPEAPASCFFDEGYGRRRPCDSGTR